MRRPNNSKIFSIKFLLLVSLLSWGFNTSEGSVKDWIIYAQAYIEADKLIALDGAEGKSTFLEDLKKRDEAVKQFKESKPPSVEEIEVLLNSQNVNEQVIACVGIMLTGKYSTPIIEKLIKNLQTHGPYDLKRYSVLSLGEVNLVDLGPYEDGILQAIEVESNEQALIDEMLFISRFSPEKSSRILTNLLANRESIRIKVFAYGNLHRLGPEYSQRAIEELKQKGDKETLKLIDRMSSGNPLKEDLDK